MNLCGMNGMRFLKTDDAVEALTMIAVCDRVLDIRAEANRRSS